MNDYDNWKLDNDEQAIQCTRCSCNVDYPEEINGEPYCSECTEKEKQ